MIEIPLTKKGAILPQVALIDNNDYERVVSYQWHLHSQGYVVTGWSKGGNPTFILMHRLIMLADQGEYVDHRNGNRLDNRKTNLRICTQAQNMQNAQKLRGGTSGFKGVSFHKQSRLWYARLKYLGKDISLGCYHSELEAARAYDDAAREYFGEFAYLNFQEVE